MESEGTSDAACGSIASAAPKMHKKNCLLHSVPDGLVNWKFDYTVLFKYDRSWHMILLNTSIKQVACSLLLTTFYICSFATSTISAQTVEFVDKYNEKFLKKEPKIGDTVKEVSVFDAQGKTMKLSSAQGKYTVLIFGCLT